MKTALLALAALFAINTVGAHHRCDDVNTAATNAMISPLAKAV